MDKINKLQCISEAMRKAEERAKSALIGLDQIDLPKILDESIRSVPVNAREQDEDFTYCSSMTAYTGDIACDPRSGAVIGMKNMAAFYGVSPEHYRDSILPMCRSWMRYYYGKPVSHVNSVVSHATEYIIHRYNTWNRNLNKP